MTMSKVGGVYESHSPVTWVFLWGTAHLSAPGAHGEGPSVSHEPRPHFPCMFRGAMMRHALGRVGGGEHCLVAAVMPRVEVRDHRLISPFCWFGGLKPEGTRSLGYAMLKHVWESSVLATSLQSKLLSHLWDMVHLRLFTVLGWISFKVLFKSAPCGWWSVSLTPAFRYLS